jgi:hypothetical protein
MDSVRSPYRSKSLIDVDEPVKSSFLDGFVKAPGSRLANPEE